jgi:hypothetical protein
MHCSVLNVITVSTFGFKIIATAFQISIKKTSLKKYHQNFSCAKYTCD